MALWIESEGLSEREEGRESYDWWILRQSFSFLYFLNVDCEMEKMAHNDDNSSEELRWKIQFFSSNFVLCNWNFYFHMNSGGMHQIKETCDVRCCFLRETLIMKEGWNVVSRIADQGHRSGGSVRDFLRSRSKLKEIKSLIFLVDIL